MPLLTLVLPFPDARLHATDKVNSYRHYTTVCVLAELTFKGFFFAEDTGVWYRRVRPRSVNHGWLVFYQFLVKPILLRGVYVTVHLSPG
jgi:hypothetical protein